MKRKFIAAVAGVFLLLAAMPAYAGITDKLKDLLLGGPDSSKSSQEVDIPPGALTKEAVVAGMNAKVVYFNPDDISFPRFKVTLDSSTVDLSAYRMVNEIILRDSKGKKYRADLVSMSGSISHREAVLEFKAAYLENSSFVELVISEVGGVNGEMVFRFRRP